MGFMLYFNMLSLLFFPKVNKISNEVKICKILPALLNITLGTTFKSQIDVPSNAGRPKMRDVHKPQEIFFFVKALKQELCFFSCWLGHFRSGLSHWVLVTTTLHIQQGTCWIGEEWNYLKENTCSLRTSVS